MELQKRAERADMFFAQLIDSAQKMREAKRLLDRLWWNEGVYMQESQLDPEFVADLRRYYEIDDGE